MPNKPTIIFADENHMSGFLGDFLSDLAPTLKEMDYQDFYFESPAKLNLEGTKDLLKNNLEETKLGIKHILDIQKELKEKEIVYTLLGIEHVKFMFILKLKSITDPHQFQAYIALLGVIELLKEQRGKDFCFADLLNAIDNITDQFATSFVPTLTFINLLNAIQQNDINYHGTDINNLTTVQQAILPNSMSSLSKFAINAAKNKVHSLIIGDRDTRMTNNYLTVKKPSFGFCGLLHVPGIQEKLIKKIGLERAKAIFHFIYIYTLPDNDPLLTFMEQHKNISQSLPTIKDFRDGTINCPLGITLIDGRGKSKEELMQLAIKTIEEKNIAYQQLPGAVKEIPDLSYTGMVKSSMSGLFKTIGNMKSRVQLTISEHSSKPTAPTNS